MKAAEIWEGENSSLKRTFDGAVARERGVEEKEEFLHLLHQVVQHTPLKLSETSGAEYDKGYIFYQDMVLRDVEELETTMWEWHCKTLQAERQKREEMVEAKIKETVQYIDKFESFEFASAEAYVEKLVALSQLNNPK